MIECTRFKSYPRGTLLGFADFKLGNMGVEFLGCGVHQKNGKRWVNLPSRQSDEDGETRWFPVVRLIEESAFRNFKDEAVKAFDQFCDNQVSVSEDDENLPF